MVHVPRVEKPARQGRQDPVEATPFIPNFCHSPTSDQNEESPSTWLANSRLAIGLLTESRSPQREISRNAMTNVRNGKVIQQTASNDDLRDNIILHFRHSFSYSSSSSSTFINYPVTFQTPIIIIIIIVIIIIITYLKTKHVCRRILRPGLPTSGSLPPHLSLEQSWGPMNALPAHGLSIS
ncbi:hypothetical protein N7519_007448 [Penicillium mononematosum]|uniref:uncharacterized protein n=1 Tax=Penicillium mononematosum TaxID=268346 RepID=UPI00254665F6|nr:uncharacterized protein N7519_007448 [Penicillium mononematosum]KAJ6186147.1 hypothetical protein N7519_007448 [Penicillium mononematosum]